MTYHIAHENGCLYLTPAGEIDLQITSELKDAISSHLGEQRCPAVIEISAGQVSYIDSSGIALLLYIQKTAAEKNISSRLLEISAAIAHVLKLARLDSLLKAERIISS